MKKIAYTATLVTPLHHGSGSSGNTSLLRTEDVVAPDGRMATVPFVSGNSIRHLIRTALAWHAAQHLDFQPGTLPKPLIDLLWSGGSVTTTGAEVNLELARQVSDIFPMLSLLGYAAQSDMTAGTLEVSNLCLVCEENAWRSPAHKFASMPAARFRGEEFGTRHDVSGSPVDRFMDTVAGATGTTQMIYDLQVLKPGSVMWGELRTRWGATENEERVLAAALTLLAPDGTVGVGAKTGVGYGSVRVDGWPAAFDAIAWWSEHLESHRTQVTELLTELAS